MYKHMQKKGITTNSDTSLEEALLSFRRKLSDIFSQEAVTAKTVVEAASSEGSGATVQDTLEDAQAKEHFPISDSEGAAS